MKLLILSISCFILLQISLITNVICQSKSRVKPVVTYLNAKWFNTPYLLEAAEFLAEESSNTFWAFIDEINTLDLEDYVEKSEKQKYDAIIQSAGKHLTLNRINLLKFSLSLRVYSPRIEMFRQIANDRGILLQGCSTVLEINNNIYCNLEPLKQLTDEFENGNVNILDLDHVYPGSDTSKIVAVLYGELGTPEFRRFHNELKEAAQKMKLKYVLRPFVKEPLPNKVRLSGYGVELQIKSTEYKAQDDTKLHDEHAANVDSNQEDDQEIEGFIFSKLKSLHPDHEENLASFENHMAESSDDMAPLKVWQLQQLSMQTSQRIMAAPKEEMLSTFVHLSQNFPFLARSLSRTKVNEKMKREIIKNQNLLKSEIDISPTDSILFVNGMQMDLNFIDMYTMLNIISDEQRVMEGLFAMGIKDNTMRSLLKMDLSESKVEYGIDIRDSAITWLNNIELDRAYLRWPTSVNELLRPAFPGMMRSVRKNFHNLVMVIDPKKKESADILKLMESFITHISPIRFGLVLAVESNKKISGLEDVGVAMLCAFNFISQTSDSEDAKMKGLSFINDVYSIYGGTPSVSDITKMFKAQYKNEDLEDIFGQDSDYDVGRQLSRILIDKAGFRSFPQALMNGVPLPEKGINSDELEETILMEVMTNTQRMQRAVFKGELSDNHDVVDWLMAKPNIMSRLNDRILRNQGSSFIDLSGTSNDHVTPSSYAAFKTLSASEMTATIADNCHYLTTKSETHLRPLTIWIVADFETESGRIMLMEAVKYTRESNSVRFCFLNSAAEPGFFSRILHVAHNALTVPVARQVLLKTLDGKNFHDIINGKKSFKEFTITGFNPEGFESRLANFNMDVFKSHRLFLSKVLGLSPGKSTVVANGRVLGIFGDNETFTEEDFSLLENYFMSSIGDKVVEQLNGYPATDISDLVMQASGILMSMVHKKPRSEVPIKADTHSVVKLSASDPNRPSFDLIAVCDPISAAAQQIGPILQILHSVLNANVKIVLNAREKHSEMPLKSFYRYVLQSEPQFTDEGAMTAGPTARFTGLPESTILTQSFHVPDNWLVEVVKSVHDLDNIKLELFDTGVTSEFELEHLLLEGHCFEQATGNPPRGLQFTLGTKEKPIMVDTIVMANLGYFQLKGNPGNMILRLREGRSSDIYTIFSHETHTQQRDEPAYRNVDNEIGIVLSSFRPHMIKIRVAKKPQMEDQDLLYDEDEDSGGIWGSIASTFSSSKNKDDAGDDTINIFSVASGHLYERFIRIMMLSVRKHTTAKIKFWLIKNFLSPNLKDSLPILAKEFDFEYELVQYKWPRWLHQQTEKQRVIWGYKILFLDVLFPLNVTKIIFVDADQVVRDDLQKLRDFDLEGAPYGFVPFCDSRTEMEGFRFWKQGYWRNHLSGRKYHISALFVVDLKKFRRIAAGDRLRGQYQGLSADPNSLSNLDQDLPNNMVHQVRIKSLPMEWLWCETWCDDKSKGQAKVIDLCNNPLTKEAKLDAANRIISEWSDYDVTIKKVLSSLDKQSVQSKTDKVESIQLHEEL